MANAEDLNRLTACSLVLLGHIFLSLGNSQVCHSLTNHSSTNNVSIADDVLMVVHYCYVLSSVSQLYFTKPHHTQWEWGFK